MNRAKAILAVVVMLALAGCTKYSAEVEFVIMPRLQEFESSSPGNPAYEVRVYAFYDIGKSKTDAEVWAPGSYEAADAGLLRNRTTGEVRSHNLMAVQSEEDYNARLVLTSTPVILVAVDPVHEFYAYGFYEFGIPMPAMYIPVHFQIWKGNNPYKDGLWTIVSAAYENLPPEESTEDASASTGRRHVVESEMGISRSR